MASNSTKNTYGNEDGNLRDLSPVSTGNNPLFGESRGSPGSPLALCYRPLRGLNTKSKRPNSWAPAQAGAFGLPLGGAFLGNNYQEFLKITRFKQRDESRSSSFDQSIRGKSFCCQALKFRD